MQSSGSTFAPLSAPPQMRPPLRRGLSLAALGFVIYALGLVYAPGSLGAGGAASFLVVPLSIIAWQFGMGLGLLAAAICVPLGFLITIRFTGFRDGLGVTTPLIGHLAIVAIVAVVGRLRDLGLQSNRELVEHARAQRLLRQKQTQSDALLSALPDTIFRLGENGELRGASGGRAPSGGAPRRIEDLVPMRAAELIRARAARVMTTGEAEELEYDVHDGDRVYDFEARLVACGTDEVIGILRDVTTRKRLERELIGAREAALEAARVKTKFLANMSHEIRTPMNGVIGMTNLLRETNLSREQAEYADIIHKSGQTLLEIIDDILDFAKIEAGKMELDEVDFDLRASVYESVEAFAGQAFAKGLDMATIFSSDVATRVVGDPTRLRQVLANLLSNAVKFTDHGDVLMRVEEVSRRPGQYLVRFSVSDTGLGLNEAAREKLFQPMLLGEKDGGEDASRRGTGLGLAICAELVQLMGGEIGVDSTVGEGTTFWFTARLGTSELTTSSESKLAPPDPTGARVLLLQNSGGRRLLAEELKAFGMVPEVANAEGAVAQLQDAERARRPFVAVIVDMPRDPKAALACVEAIRSESASRQLPMLAVDAPEGSAPAFRDDLRRAVGRMLSWPVRQDELFGALTAAMGRSHEESIRRSSSVNLPIASSELALGVRVLVAEDNVVNQRVAQRTLQLLGCDCVMASDGREAVDLALQGTFDVVLMDCQMPEMDGFEATREIRRRQTDRYIPIIAMTASNMKGERDRCLQAHMDDFLCKPVTVPELREVLDRWASGKVGAEGDREQLGPQSELDVPVGDAIERKVMEQLMELGDGDTEFVMEMIDLFLDQTPRNLDAMRTSLSVGDLESVSKSAHSMKSSAAYLGAVRMGELCKVVEAKGRQGDSVAVTRGVEALHAEFERVQKALQIERSALTSSS